MAPRPAVVIGVLVALDGVLTFRYVVRLDVGERCYLFIRRARRPAAAIRQAWPWSARRKAALRRKDL